MMPLRESLMYRMLSSGQECQAVGHDEIAHKQSQGAQVSGYAKDAGNGLLPRRRPQRLRHKCFSATGATWIPVVSGTGLCSNSTVAT